VQQDSVVCSGELLARRNSQTRPLS
jgi:hypothetical protein